METFTLFENCRSRVGREVDWQEIVDTITDGRLARATQRLREAVEKGDQRQVHEVKSGMLPALMPCCHCSEGRDEKHLTSYTGIGQADFDHLTPERLALARQRLMADPYVLMLHTSASGLGLHVFYRYKAPLPSPPPKGRGEPEEPKYPGRPEEPEKVNVSVRSASRQGDAFRAKRGKNIDIEFYTQAFRQGNRYLSEVACADSDTAMEPAVHLACLAHDPDAYYNPQAMAFSVDMTAPLKKPTQRDTVTLTTPVCQKDWPQTWTAREVCQLARTLRDRHDTYMRGNRHHYLVGLAFLLSDYGVDEGEAVAFLEREFSDYDDEPLNRLVGDCYRRSAASHGMRRLPSRRSVERGPGKVPGMVRTAQKRMTRVEQVEGFLAGERLRFDMLSRRLQQWEGGRWVEVDRRRENTLFCRCCRQLGCNVPQSVFRSVLNSGSVPDVHPLRMYIESLPDWDPEKEPDYIREVADMVRVEPGTEELWAECFRRWLVAMVAGWMSDHVVNHHVLVLIGEQGIFKTTWIEALMPPELADYVSKQGTHNFSDKDEQLRSTQYGLINLDEIDHMSERDLQALKSMVTNGDVNVRAAYEANTVKRYCVASYAASGNNEQFLSDPTGNRRWLPFKALSIQDPHLCPIPHQGLYAQARHLLRSGFEYWFPLERIRQLASHVEQFETQTSEEQLLEVYFQPCDEGTPGARLLTTAEILSKLVTFGNIRHPMSLVNLGRLLRKHGFVSKRVGKKKLHGFIVLEKTTETINAERSIGAHGMGMVTDGTDDSME